MQILLAVSHAADAYIIYRCYRKLLGMPGVPPPLEWGEWLTLETRASATSVSKPNLVAR